MRETLAHFFVLFFLCRHQNTVIMAARSRAPLASAASASSSSNGGELTVEQFLNQQMVEITNDVQKHAQQLIARLKAEYLEGAQEVRALMSSSSSQAAKEEKKLCVLLKCVAGAHIGQKFMLEPATSSGEDVFKMGRSTGKLFKEKGVSLYKDKEISTTHGCIEIRNGQVFFFDADSTTGSQLNGADAVAQAPMRLRNGDVITMGGTELSVHISDMDGDDKENDA